MKPFLTFQHQIPLTIACSETIATPNFLPLLPLYDECVQFKALAENFMDNFFKSMIT